MKKLLTLVTAVALISSVASAQLLKNFKYNGSIEVNAYNINNADFNDNTNDNVGDVGTRLMLNMGFDLSDDVNAVVTAVKNNRKWAEGSENFNTWQTNISFEQAYLNLKGVIGMDHKLGRQFYGNEQDLVIYYGPKMWPYTKNVGDVSAIDAWVGTYNYNDWTFTGILGKEERDNNHLGTNISGIDVKKKIDRFHLNGYYYSKVKNTNVANQDDYLGVLGFRANWECQFVKNLNLGIEFDKNMGRDKNNNEYKGYAYKINVDYSMNLAGQFGLNGEYTFLSGQGTSADKKDYIPINSDYRSGIISDGFGLHTSYIGPPRVNRIGTGAKVIKVGFNWTPEKLNKLNLAVDYINAKVAEKNTNMNDTVGNEYDIVATWNHSDKVSVKGYYAMFKPDKDNAGGTDDMYTALGAAFVVKF